MEKIFFEKTYFKITCDLSDLFLQNIKFMYSSRQVRPTRDQITTSSTNRTRFERKNGGVTNGRISHSKSKQKLEKSAYDTSYIKNVSLEKNKSVSKENPPLRRVHKEISTTIKSSINPIMVHVQRKRSPTPSKSRKHLKISQETRELNFDQQIKINELETQYFHEKKLHQKYERLFVKTNKDFSICQENYSNLKSKNSELLEENKKKDQKIKELEKAILLSQSDLSLTKSNFQKLKQTIKQNRIVQLQWQNKKIKHQLDQLIFQKGQIIQQKESMQKQIQYLIEENRKIKSGLQYDKNQGREKYLVGKIDEIQKSLEISKQQKENYLEDRLRQSQQELFAYKEQIKALKIKLHTLQHQKSEEFTDFKKKKEGQLKVLKVKYSKVVKELGQKKRENPYDLRLSMIERSRHDHFMLELSPES